LLNKKPIVHENLLDITIDVYNYIEKLLNALKFPFFYFIISWCWSVKLVY